MLAIRRSQLQDQVTVAQRELHEVGGHGEPLLFSILPCATLSWHTCSWLADMWRVFDDPLC